MGFFGQWCSHYNKADCLILLLAFLCLSFLGGTNFHDSLLSLRSLWEAIVFIKESDAGVSCSCGGSWTRLALGYSIHHLEHCPVYVSSSKYARYHSKSCGDHRWELGTEPALGYLQFNLGEDHSPRVVHSTKCGGRPDVLVLLSLLNTMKVKQKIWPGWLQALNWILGAYQIDKEKDYPTRGKTWKPSVFRSWWVNLLDWTEGTSGWDGRWGRVDRTRKTGMPDWGQFA